MRTLGRLVLAIALMATATLSAQSGAFLQPNDSARSADAQTAADPWGFEEEEDEAPRALDLVRAQAVDLALFAAFAALALVSFFRKSDRLKIVTLVAAVAYLGFYKSQLLSVTNLFSVLSWNLPLVSYSLGWYAFAVSSLVATILWGRVYCGRVCAFGALTQLMDRVAPRRWQLKIPKAMERRAGFVKYGVLALVIVYYLTTRDIRIYRAVEPFWMFTLQGSAPMWIGLAVLLTATLFVRNLYCRFLCPIGALLGVLSNLTVFRIKRWSECRTCKICEKACEWGAIQGPRIIASECVRCDDCERLYMNTQKCPHWIIIQRKSDIMARRSAAPVA